MNDPTKQILLQGVNCSRLFHLTIAKHLYIVPRIIYLNLIKHIRKQLVPQIDDQIHLVLIVAVEATAPFHLVAEIGVIREAFPRTDPTVVDLAMETSPCDVTSHILVHAAHLPDIEGTWLEGDPIRETVTVDQRILGVGRQVPAPAAVVAVTGEAKVSLPSLSGQLAQEVVLFQDAEVLPVF